MLDWVWAFCALVLIFPTAGMSMAIRIVMIPITTSSSTRVKAGRLRLVRFDKAIEPSLFRLPNADFRLPNECQTSNYTSDNRQSAFSSFLGRRAGHRLNQRDHRREERDDD